MKRVYAIHRWLLLAGSILPFVSFAQGPNASLGDGSLKTYSNYDFVPGEKILFEDHFTDDQDGEFPAHWRLTSGQGIVNMINGMPAFAITDGNYAKVGPRMKVADNYLPDNFTLEFDFYSTPGGYMTAVFFKTKTDEDRIVNFGNGVNTNAFPNDLSADFPGDRDHFDGRWHHAALIHKGTTLKMYIDQYRVLVMPDDGGTKLVKFDIGGIASKEQPLVITNVRLAEGGNMNVLGQKFTDAKIITHGINFDVDKATIRPESMGTLNMIVKILQNNPGLKFEVDGHTDNTGTAAHNLQLSQQRADAIRSQLVGMGVDGSRLTTKGCGDTKPMADNTTPEGKANNRRVEFVKVS